MNLCVAGIDEVGRGCLAGPVYAAAVVLPEGHGLIGLKDSKALSALQRERLVPLIEAVALDWAIGIASAEEIDAINILQATFLAMQRAVAALKTAPTLCLIDGSQQPRLPVPIRMVIGGDRSEDAIMAAAIIAKVARDAEMTRLDAQFPAYGLAKHKGYGTPAHLKALREQGASVIHRMSFAPCSEATRLAR
ncbi:ribonuclease HII [uncultured Nevskia sp.]|uniref:ribonuclease HII n=1 Tax=uncultured Nevskia sp. TaxID=228950 RepID=UPI0025E9F35C|nr:ribonuclease HII [uncultured Nevskia sp.]